MLKTDTLKKNYEFKNILSRGKYYKGKFIDIYIKRNNKNINNIGIAVGVKVAKAIRRNRIKRLIRETYRLEEKNIKIGNDIVFLWKKNKDIDIEQIKLNDIREDIINVLKISNIYYN